jgi:hypothetical protein
MGRNRTACDPSKSGKGGQNGEGEPYGDHAVTRKLLRNALVAKSFRGEAKHTEIVTAANTIYMDVRRCSHVEMPVPAAK